MARLALAIVLMAAGGCAADAQGDVMERALALHRETPLIDGHNDYPWALRQADVGLDLTRLDIRAPQPRIHTDIPRLREGGVGAIFWSIYVRTNPSGPAAVRATLEQFDVVHRMMRQYPGTFELASTADDVERIFKAGKIASLMGVEGGHSIDNSLAILRLYYQLGARYMTLTHSAHTDWADSSAGEPVVGGLNAFGEAVVREMNRLGMLVDLSHTARETMIDALRVSEAPVIFSHSSARAITDHPRNVPDDVLERLRANGGVVMVTFVPDFVGRDGKATLADVANHIDHIRRVAGVDHVGIGSDFDGIDTVPDGLEDVSKFPALTAELMRRGWSDDDLRKLLGQNLLRVLRAAESVAAR